MTDKNTVTAEEVQKSADILDYYRSLNPANREIDGTIIDLAVQNGVVPSAVHYDVFKNVYRGVMKSVDGGLHYFQLPPNGVFHIVKADTPEKSWEASQLMGRLAKACDLIRSDDALEDEEKAGGGITGPMMPPSVTEEQAVRTADEEITERHPGGTVATTPEQDGSAERWHGSGHLERALDPIDSSVNPNAWDTIGLIKAWGEQLHATAPRVATVDPVMKQFMVEVLGKSATDIDAGRVRLNSQQRAQYSTWVAKSLRGSLNGLQSWLQKSRKE